MNGWPAEKVGKCVHGGRKKEATFPAQALSCSGSTGIISAKYSPAFGGGMLQHPGNFRKPVFRRQYKDMYLETFFCVLIK